MCSVLFLIFPSYEPFLLTWLNRELENTIVGLHKIIFRNNFCVIHTKILKLGHPTMLLSNSRYKLEGVESKMFRQPFNLAG